MKTSVTTSSDALARKGAATARVRSGANGGTHGARSDATRRATRKGSMAQKRRGRKGGVVQARGGGGLSHLGGGAFSANSSALPGSTRTMSVSRKPQSAVQLTF